MKLIHAAAIGAAMGGLSLMHLPPSVWLFVIAPLACIVSGALIVRS
jgi:hypothetical protein